MKASSLTAQAHERLKRHIRSGNSLIDATAGNGHDTLFLAQQTGPNGHVFAFDPQVQAIESTRQRLEKNTVDSICTLINEGHENMEQHIPPSLQGKISAITFNLGYLPGANKEITTQVATTLVALDQSLHMLEPSGLISLMIYKGHPAGKTEALAVTKWLTSGKNITVERLTSVNPTHSSPELVIISKQP